MRQPGRSVRTSLFYERMERLRRRSRHFVDMKQGYERIWHEIPALWSPDSELLMLGSLPSPKSRETGFYYGHPRNRFWRVMAAVFEEPIPEDVEAKRSLMLRHRIALWDVIDNCLIRGASDSSIKDPVPNDIAGLMKKTHIRRIFTTGARADELYMKLCYPDTGLASIRLPSTSPANCAMKDQEIIRIYKENIL